MLYNDNGQLIYRKTYDLSGALVETEGDVENEEVLSYFNQLKTGTVTELLDN